MSKIHLELLDNIRQKVFKQLAVFSKTAYLAGGTGLALQLNHRRSEDFDIFVSKAIDNTLRLKIKEVFGRVDFYINTGDQISFKTNDGVNITFLWYYYKPLFPTISTIGLPIASIADIAADKAQTIGRRAIWRDYVDLFFLLKGKYFTIEKIINLAKRKFAGEFVETQFLEQLSYFGDLKELPINFIDKSYSESKIKSYLEAEVENYAKKNILQ
ncbi:nucleotidyl transferase AbiEii/AbiGii toxin family protein [Candidatus Gottesmanbacteria bacterium]|nr:nucleotidyl transferase AbiEii/AbiGii toxin family protein [Candidatus Gottesmanbacteria bacterium]